MNKIFIFALVCFLGYASTVSSAQANSIERTREKTLIASVLPVEKGVLRPDYSKSLNVNPAYGLVSYDADLRFTSGDALQDQQDIILIGAAYAGHVSTFSLNADQTANVLIKTIDGYHFIYKNLFVGSLVFKDGAPVLAGEVLGKSTPARFSLSITDKNSTPLMPRIENDKITVTALHDIRVNMSQSRERYGYITSANQADYCRIINADNAIKSALTPVYNASISGLRPPRPNFTQWCNTDNGLLSIMQSLTTQQYNDVVATYCQQYPSEQSCFQQAASTANTVPTTPYDLQPLGPSTGGYSISSSSGSADDMAPFGDADPNATADGLTTLGDDSLCNVEVAADIEEARQGAREQREEIRSSILTDPMDLADLSCIDIYESNLYTQVADTFTNTATGFFGDVFGKLAGGIAEDLAGQTCENMRYQRDLLMGAGQNQVNAMFAGATQGDAAWQRATQSYTSRIRPSDYITPENIRRAAEQANGPLDAPFE